MSRRLRSLAAVLLLAGCGPDASRGLWPAECADIPQPAPEYMRPPPFPVRSLQASLQDAPSECRDLAMRMGESADGLDHPACGGRDPVLGYVEVLPRIDGSSVTVTRWACWKLHERAHQAGADPQHVVGWLR